MYHILIVDEEEHLLWALERNLFPERSDVEVHTAGTGEEGLQILEEESIDLLISDIKMPGDIDGFQLILRAKEMVPDARVMIITAFGTHRIQNFAERIGISHYIEKPFTVDELRGAVLEVLDEKEGFQGVLSDLELTDIIQMLCLAKRTALLHLKHRDRRGRIVFDAGDVVHAEFDGEVGPEAVYEMLNLRQGDIFMQSDFEPVERTIDMGWQDLLLEAVKRTDEKRMEEEREKTRREMGSGTGPRLDGGDSEEEAASEADDDGSAKRTKTPMGMGAPTMDAGDDSGATMGDEASGAMLFSEEELEEINEASEAAVIEEGEDQDDEQGGELSGSETFEEVGGSAGDTGATSTPHEPESAPDHEIAPFGSEDDGDEPWPPPTAEQQLEAPSKSEDIVSESPPQQESESTGAGASQPVEDVTSQPEDHQDDWASANSSGQWATPSEQQGGAFGRGGNLGDDGPSNADSNVDNRDSLGADGEARPPVDERGPFASADRRSKNDSGTPFTQTTETVGDDSGTMSRAEPSEPPEERRRSETSPGMSTVDPDAHTTTEESGEYQMFAAPALEEASSPDDDPSPTGPAERTGPLLREFSRECPGLKATAVMSQEPGGSVHCIDVAYDGHLDERELTSGLSAVFGRAARSVSALEDDDRLQEVQLVLGDEYLLVRSIDKTSMLHAVIVDRQVSLGIALVLMRKLGEQLAPS